jgi:hypothetical protein
MELELIRISERSATQGVLLIDGVPFCLTLEREWALNARNMSCIPSGSYLCQKLESPKFGLTLWLKNVPERSGIIIHSGNTTSATRGCVLLGLQFGELGGKPAVLHSRRAMNRFRERIREISSAALHIYYADSCRQFETKIL